MKKDDTTQLGREYFLESLPVEWDEKLDGLREADRKKTGDVKVNHADLAHLKALGLIRCNSAPL